MYRYLLGYDIRLCLEDYDGGKWDEVARNAFLLQHDVKWPLSVDRSIWPSAFKTSPFDFHDYKNAIRIEEDFFHYQVFHLWDDLCRMKSRFLRCEDNVARQGIVIAAVLVTRGPLQSDTNWEAHWSALSSASSSMGSVPEEWMFLGYDVAEDAMVFSGLCGYQHQPTEDWKQLRKKWGPRLNDHGLFSNVDDAMEFTPIAAEFDPNEAPFYVYAIYRDPEILRTENMKE
jgi:hypothetical protein